MNEQRQDAYLKLIQQLINCPNKQRRILELNQDLLDGDFL